MHRARLTLRCKAVWRGAWRESAASGPPRIVGLLPVIARDSLAIAVAAAAVGPDVENEREGDDDPPDEVQSADRPEQDVGDRRPGQEDEAERRQEEALEHKVPAGRIDQPPEEDQCSRAKQAHDGDRATHGRDFPQFGDVRNGTRAPSMSHAGPNGNGRVRAQQAGYHRADD